jgi:hypothetical protein
MVPLTDAWIEFTDGKVRRRDRVDALIVNRDQVDWIIRATGDEVELPDVPLQAALEGHLKPIGS